MARSRAVGLEDVALVVDKAEIDTVLFGALVFFLLALFGEAGALALLVVFQQTWPSASSIAPKETAAELSARLCTDLMPCSFRIRCTPRIV